MSASDLTGTEQTLPGAPAAPPLAKPADGPNWQEQDSLLREMWMQNQSPAEIAKALDRSIPAIMTRAARLGLPRRFAPGRKPGRRPLDAATTTRAETQRAASVPAEARDIASQVSTRVCLMCLTKFQSQGRHNRICPTCKNSAEFESGSRLPEFVLPSGDV